MITRIAPTPSGFLHTGNIYNFLLNWLWAKSNGGKVLLRIDDADTQRKRPEYVEDIFRVLDWLGLTWDIGPTGPDDFERNWSQSLRLSLYNNLLDELLQQQLIFACTCSRTNTESLHCSCAQKNTDPVQLNAAWRIIMPRDCTINFPDKRSGNIHIDLYTEAGTFTVKRKDGIPAYQVCSLADDRHFGVTHICRGQDLITSTAMQLYIDANLHANYLQRCNFWHHPLVAGNEGLKLSKSAGANSGSMLRDSNKEAVFAGFGKWLGYNNKIPFYLEELIGLDIFK